MKKSLILSMIGLMLNIETASGGNPGLVIGEMRMEGNGCAKLVQRLHVEVTNINSEEYRYWAWRAENGQEEYGISEEIILAPGETKWITIDMIFEKEGHYDVYVTEPAAAWEEPLFIYSVDISEYKAPRLKGEIQLDMLEQTDGGNILYGDFNHFRITGTFTVTNKDEYTYFGWGHNQVLADGYPIACYVNPCYDTTLADPFCGLLGEIKPGETITKDILFEFVTEPEEDKEYGIQLTAYPGEMLASIPFIVRQCTNTYWTADGHVKPLPVKDNQVLEIPVEALTVDMRGQYEINTIFSVDVSQANPNCLYFLGYLDNVPQGFSSSQNVIRDYEAKMITIDGDRDYYSPMSFKAKEVLFNYTPESIDPTLSQMTNGTVVLPFDATKAWLSFANDSPGNDADFYGNTLQIFRYSGENSDDEIIIEPVMDKKLNAYEPYFISSPPSPIVFYAENAMIPSTRPAMTEGAEYDFIGFTTQIAAPEGAYQWNADDDCFYLSNLEEKITWTRPFTAMMYAKNFPYIYDKLVLFNKKEPSKIDAVSVVSSENSAAVYSLSGQRVGTAEVNEGRLTASGLRPGIYIVGGKKVIVK